MYQVCIHTCIDMRHQYMYICVYMILSLGYNAYTYNITICAFNSKKLSCSDLDFLIQKKLLKSNLGF